MMKLFDPDFFKFFIGFLVILVVSLIIFFVTGQFSADAGQMPV